MKIPISEFTLRSHDENTPGVNLHICNYTFAPGLTRSKFGHKQIYSVCICVHMTNLLSYVKFACK